MTRILILYTTFGSGHLSASKALAEAFLRFPDVEVETRDILEMTDPLIKKAMQATYNRLSEQAPRLYRTFYEGSDTKDIGDQLTSNQILGLVGAPFLQKLRHYIEDMSPDVIVCTQQLPAVFYNHFRMDGKFSQPFYIVVTDFVAHSSWINVGAAGYFLPSDVTAWLLRQMGVEEYLLHVTGIPIKLELTVEKDQMTVREQRGYPLDSPLVALFGGGLDPQRVRLMVTQMLQSPIQGTMVLVAGRNKKLIDALSDLVGNATVKLEKYQHIDFVDDLVAASDLVITKSGGLIVSEILARGTPMIIIDPIPGQEEWNADFVAGEGAGIQIRMPEMVPAATLSLLSHSERVKAMGENARRVGRPRAALRIAEKILMDMHKLA